MTDQLKIAVGQYSDKGRKDCNQDFHGVCVPKEPQLGSKGIAVAIADGISSSDVSQVASQAAVTSFLEDYYCTSDAWSVKTSVERVMVATNSWLHAQTQESQYRYDKDRGSVCTLSALVLKSTTAYIFHVGDSRIYHLRNGALDQLTDDHRVRVSSERSYLSRAMGFHPRLEIDYQTLQAAAGDVFVLATDGVYEHVAPDFIIAAIAVNGANLDLAAAAIGEEAYRGGSMDNLTVQLVRIEALPSPQASEIHRQLAGLPFPPILAPREVIDGYAIVREVRGSSRSHIYLATDTESNATVILKAPSIDLQGDPAYLERFLMEEWVARRINSAHVLKPCVQTRQRNYLYVVTEFIDGQTLAQWMIDHPKPDLKTVRGIVEQIATGLRAFHKLEMLHQDIKPDNIMIDQTGTVKIIDFGSTRVAGMMEIATPAERLHLLGAAQYAAPEYFLGESGSQRSDLFSLGVLAYQMLTGKLPYGTEVPKASTRAAQRKLAYRCALYENREIPAWVDEAIRKAVHPEPHKRYEALSEFVFDLHRPNQGFLNKTRAPLIERNPLAFWKGVAFVLMLAILVILFSKSLSG
jgi:serine/threonine protein phosphatase PrpC/predicted Ser/Thr protein kinase